MPDTFCGMVLGCLGCWRPGLIQDGGDLGVVGRGLPVERNLIFTPYLLSQTANGAADPFILVSHEKRRWAGI